MTKFAESRCTDLDSLCSALLLAYLRTHTSPHNLHVPLCHLHRDDLTLRPEFTEVLRRASASPNDVITLDELSEVASAAEFKENTEWLLVDHNCLTGKLEQYRDRVIGCIDHHDDEGCVPRESSIRVIEKTGSCTSLVANHCRDAWDELKSQENAVEVDSQIAYLALGPILIDTNNLENKDKTTALDENAVKFLEGKVSTANFDTTSFFNTIAKLKEDISPLSMRDILRKDYKEWEDGGLKLGTSSVPASFSVLQEKAGDESQLVGHIENWGQEKELDLVTVLTAFKKDGNFSRELLLLASSKSGIDAVKRFEDEQTGELGLSAWGDGKLDSDEQHKWRKCWNQANVKNSRKQVAPMLRQAMDAPGK